MLETPQSILKGGVSGPAVVAGKSGESLLLKVAAHLEEPIMPPADNGVDAKPLTSEQLGLIKLWIDEGAKGEVAAKNTSLAWQSLPPGMNPIYAVAVDAGRTIRRLWPLESDLRLQRGDGRAGHSADRSGAGGRRAV